MQGNFLNAYNNSKYFMQQSLGMWVEEASVDPGHPEKA